MMRPLRLRWLAGLALALACEAPVLPPLERSPTCVDPCTGQACRPSAYASAEQLAVALEAAGRRQLPACVDYGHAARNVEQRAAILFVELPYAESAGSCQLYADAVLNAREATRRAVIDTLEALRCGPPPTRNQPILYDADMVFFGRLEGETVCAVTHRFGDHHNEQPECEGR